MAAPMTPNPVCRFGLGSVPCNEDVPRNLALAWLPEHMLLQKESNLSVYDAVCMQTNPPSKLRAKTLFATIYDFSSAFLSKV